MKKLPQSFSLTVKDTLKTSVDDKVTGIGRGTGKPAADVVDGVFMNACGGGTQGILALKESRPGRVNPVLVEYSCLHLGSSKGFLQDLFIFVSYFLVV